MADTQTERPAAAPSTMRPAFGAGLTYWAHAQMGRLLGPIGVVILAAMLSPYLPPQRVAAWMAAYGLSIMFEFAVCEFAVPRAIAAGHVMRGWCASALLQFLSCALIASVGVWGWNPARTATNFLLIAMLFLVCLTRSIRKPQPIAVTMAASSPLLATIILAPWLGGSEVAAEITMLTLIALAYFVIQNSRARADEKAIQQLTESLRREDSTRLATQAALTQLKNELDAAQFSRRQLLAWLKADLRGPLVRLLQLSTTLKAEHEATGEARVIQQVAELRLHCMTLQDSIADITDLGSLESGGLALKSEQLDLQATLSEIVQGCSVRLIDAQLSVELITFPDLPALLADVRHLCRMVMNLVINAARDTPPGGRVTITALRLPDGGLGLRVASTGAGLSESDLDVVIDALVSGRSERPYTEHQDGLALMVVEALIALHGGSLSFRVRIGSGVQATLNFPPERVISRTTLVRLFDAA